MTMTDYASPSQRRAIEERRARLHRLGCFPITVIVPKPIEPEPEPVQLPEPKPPTPVRVRVIGDYPPIPMPVIHLILNAVSRHFNVSRNDLISPERFKKVIIPRHIAAYLCKHLAQKSFVKIGQEFGGRDHTTIMHACRKIALLRQSNDAVNCDIKEICNALAEKGMDVSALLGKEAEVPA